MNLLILPRRHWARLSMSMRMLKRLMNHTADMMGFRTSIMAHFDTHQISHATDEHKAIMAEGRQESIEAAKN